LAPEGYALGIAAEGGDVVTDPFYGFALVEKAWVAVCETFCVREAEDVYAVAWMVSYRFDFNRR
jgi:hypothetical protein